MWCQALTYNCLQIYSHYSVVHCFLIRHPTVLAELLNDLDDDSGWLIMVLVIYTLYVFHMYQKKLKNIIIWCIIAMWSISPFSILECSMNGHPESLHGFSARCSSLREYYFWKPVTAQLVIVWSNGRRHSSKAHLAKWSPNVCLFHIRFKESTPREEKR